jgi:predicted nucleic acid-binding Zn ribbon protein
MALTHCPACNGEISDGTATCYHCGEVLKPEQDHVRRVLLKAYNVGCLIVLALLTSAFVFWLVRTLS